MSRAISDDFNEALTSLCEAARFYGGEETNYNIGNGRQCDVNDAAKEYFDLLTAFREKFGLAAQ